MSLIHLVDDDAAVTDACHFLLTSFGHNVQCWNDSTGFLTQADLWLVASRVKGWADNAPNEHLSKFLSIAE